MDNNENSSNSNKTSHKPIIVGAICACAGVVLGALGFFGITKLMGQNTPGCTEKCDCPKCLIGEDVSKNLAASFLKLEASDKNIIYGPLSINYGLSLLRAGADGETKSEIDKVLGDVELSKYSNIEDKLSLANAVFIKESWSDTVLPSYINTVEQDFNAEVIYDKLQDSAPIKKWVANKTFDLIKDFDISINPDTRMVLANALAIQLDWQHKFDTEDTGGKNFYKSDGSEIIATTMNLSTSADDVKYYIDDDVTLLSLPLESVGDAALDFVAVMPSGELSNYINTLDLDAVMGNLGAAKPASTPKDGVEISIPKFKFEYSLDFVNDLKSLGINSAFDGELADFSRMSTLDNLYVSDAIHKANIDFSEEGIKAAAITVFVMNDITAIGPTPQEKVTIRIDKPFLFLIRDRNNDTIWFIGSVYEPNLWENDANDYTSW